jgi:Fe-S cluster assembly protein SufD
MTANTAQLLPFVDRFDEIAPQLAGDALPWVRTLRGSGLAQFRALGVPTAKVESWRYTNLNRLRRADFAPASLARPVGVERVPADKALSIDAYLVVSVNGAFRPDLSFLPEAVDGIQIASLAEMIERDPALIEPWLGRIAATDDAPMAALNTAYLTDGTLIHLREGFTAEKPIHLVSIGAGADEPVVFHPRLLVIAEANSTACVIESHVGSGDNAYFSNGVSEIALAQDARLSHYRLQNEHADASHLAMTQVAVGARAAYESFVLQIGGRLARDEIRVRLGERSECRLNGAYLLRGNQHADNTTSIEHDAPGGMSRELYKGVLDDQARAVFQGRILVRQGAQKTDGHQLNKTLLLSRGAEIDSKPELEIYADDVQCSHGATTGELEEDALFYLESRGIDRETARALMVEAFVAEAVDQVKNEAAQAAFRRVVADWLAETNRKKD